MKNLSFKKRIIFIKEKFQYNLNFSKFSLTKIVHFLKEKLSTEL